MPKNKTDHRQKKYNHISIEERELISIYLAQGHNNSEISRLIGRNKSTIAREIERNSAPINDCQYLANRADLKYRNRIKNARKSGHLHDPEIRKYVIKKIEENWSPEQISGRINTDLPGCGTNYETIYQFIYSDRPDLKKHLRKAHRIRFKRTSNKRPRRVIIKNKVSIEKRTAGAINRSRLGHFESDTMISRNSRRVLQVVVDRKSRKTLLKLQLDKSAESTERTICKLLGKESESRVLSITYDNGTENANHQEINKILKTKSYFCQPYHSWEKGTVENMIGLIRQYLPKKSDLDNVSNNFVKYIEDRLNNRPRKCLNYRTPNEVATGVAL